jgi:hypothetical protein
VVLRVWLVALGQGGRGNGGAAYLGPAGWFMNAVNLLAPLEAAAEDAWADIVLRLAV